jgi:hypothetical protein
MIRNTGIRIFIVVCLCAVIAVLLICCGSGKQNKKDAIVEHMKSLNRDIKHEESNMNFLKTSKELLTELYISTSNKLYRDSIKQVIHDIVFGEYKIDSMHRVYDDLELDLKKY